MTKQEFQKRIGTEISQKDYSIVEHVYTWHPSISEVEGKEQIAELYKSFGMPIIKNMMETANYAETLDRAMAQAQRQVEELRKRIIRVAKQSVRRRESERRDWRQSWKASTADLQRRKRRNEWTRADGKCQRLGLSGSKEGCSV